LVDSVHGRSVARRACKAIIGRSAAILDHGTRGLIACKRATGAKLAARRAARSPRRAHG
jgi:hypothetical protein